MSTPKNSANLFPTLKIESQGCFWKVGVVFKTVNGLPITFKEIGLATKNDPVLSKVVYLTINENDWPSHIIDDQLRYYSDKKLQLSVEKDCFLWGSRVIINTTKTQKENTNSTAYCTQECKH